MQGNELQDLYLFAYKIASLGVGITSIYLGYKLFVKGIFIDAGNFSAKGGIKEGGKKESTEQFEVSLKNAAPGTFFAFFGMLIIGFTISIGLEYNYKSTTTEVEKPVGVVIPNPFDCK